jgi:hypothetical protein
MGMGVLGNLGEEFSEEDLDQIGRGMLRLAGILKKITTPKSLALTERAADLPIRLDLDRVQPVGTRYLLTTTADPKIRSGLSIVLAVIRSLAS